MTDRRCREKGCSTRLSDYNVGPYCWVHTEREAVRGRGFHEHKYKRERESRLDPITRDDRKAYRDGSWLR